jgi:hypothetical protein
VLVDRSVAVGDEQAVVILITREVAPADAEPLGDVDRSADLGTSVRFETRRQAGVRLLRPATAPGVLQ